MSDSNSITVKVDMEYWDKYYLFWDTKIKGWFLARKNACHDSDLEKLYRDLVSGLIYDDLPEPYYGFPHCGVKAVELHHNPGISKVGSTRNTGDERQKYYSHIEDGIGWLIRKFRDNCDCSYRKFVERYSCFMPSFRSRNPLVDGERKSEICGVKWWQGLESNSINNEVKWLGQIYGRELNPDDKPDEVRLHPLEVFALELCPFHSGDFKASSRFADELRCFMIKRVFGPAIRAVHENHLPFAVARGSKFKNFFDAMRAEREMEWSHKDNVEGWPKHDRDGVKNGKVVKKKGTPINRTYRLYKMNACEGLSARFLVTWYSGAYDPPGDKFKDVERHIRNYVAKHPLE